MARCGKTQRELAHELDMCESTLVAKVKKNTLTVRDAEKMISILGIDNPTEVLFTNLDTSQVTANDQQTKTHYLQPMNGRRKGETMNNHVEIKTNDTSGEITINGISVSDIVRKYTITHEAGKPPVIEVELVGDVTVSGGFITPLPEPWKSIYHNLSKGQF